MPLETPAFERLDTLLGKYGEEGDQLLFRLLKRGEKLEAVLAQEGQARVDDLADFGLRYDLTVPLARVVAAHQGQLPRYFRRYQMQPVWRADRPQRGRFREFVQCDVDFVGTTSPLAEVEVFSAVSSALHGLGFGDVTCRINDRRILSAFLEVAGVPESAQGDVLTRLDKLDKIGPEEVRAAWRGLELPAAVVDELDALLGLASSTSALEAIRKRFEASGHASGVEGVQTLEGLLRLLGETQTDVALRFDLSLVRGLSYYTGPIFELGVADLAGSLGGGGRYDGLIGMFCGQEIPAVGFSLGFERLVVVMEERGMFEVMAPPPGIFLARLDEEVDDILVRLASAWRRAGLQVEVHPEASKLKKQLAYAASLGVRYVGMIGKREAREGFVTVKDLHSGEQRVLGQEDVPSWLRSTL